MARYDDTFDSGTVVGHQRQRSPFGIEWLLSPRSQTFLGACRQDADASKAAIRVAVGEPDFVRWATRFCVAPLRLTNP